MNAIAKRAADSHFDFEDPGEFPFISSAVVRGPGDVVANRSLSLSEKKAILASWASDACAVEGSPGLRQPPNLVERVSFDAIISALQQLDGDPRS